MGNLKVAPGTATVIQGHVGSGKTTLVRQLLAAHAEAGATCFVQDPDHQFADLFPVFDSAADYRRAAAAAAIAGEAFQRGAAIAETDDEPVTALALAVAPAVKAEGRYTVVAYDEAVLAAEPNHCTPVQRAMLARRRHLGVSVILNVQDFGQAHAIWQRLATEIFIFRCADRGRVKVIAERWGRDADRLWAALSTLPAHEWARLDHAQAPAPARGSNGAAVRA